MDWTSGWQSSTGLHLKVDMNLEAPAKFGPEPATKPKCPHQRISRMSGCLISIFNFPATFIAVTAFSIGWADMGWMGKR